MGGKKKAAAKKSKEDDVEDDSVPKFWKLYKKKCVEYDCAVSKIIKEEIAKFEEDGDKPKKFHIWEELGWVGVKAITDSLTAVAYPHC